MIEIYRNAIRPIASSTDNAVVRWDGTTGRFVQDSSVTITDGSSPEISSTSGSIWLKANGGSSTFLGKDIGFVTEPLIRIQQTGNYNVGLGLGVGGPQYTFHAKNLTGTRAYFAFQGQNSSSIAGVRLVGYTATGTGAPHWTMLFKESTYQDKLVFAKNDTHKMSLHEDTDKGLLVAGTNAYIATTPTGKLHLIQTTANEVVIRCQTAETNDDPLWQLRQYRLATTDATTQSLVSFTTTTDYSYNVRAEVLARRTGGSAGTAGDSAGYTLLATVKNISGTASIVGSVTTTHSAEDNATLAATISTSGAAITVRISGDTNNNYTWHCNFFYQELST